MLGFSGAKIEYTTSVLKTAHDAQEQGRRCRFLGEQVCPKIYHIDKDSYLMERLYAVSETPDLLPIKKLLKENVWNREVELEPWENHFVKWMENRAASFLLQEFSLLYNTPTRDGCQTHGDPTWANVMKNLAGEYRLIDPLPIRLEKPMLMEVDLGKLLQSSVNWEGVLLRNEEFMPHNINLYHVLDNESEDMIKKSVFWLKVHLWRLLPFAVKNGRPDIASKVMRSVHEICI